MNVFPCQTWTSYWVAVEADDQFNVGVRLVTVVPHGPLWLGVTGIAAEAASATTNASISILIMTLLLFLKNVPVSRSRPAVGASFELNEEAQPGSTASRDPSDRVRRVEQC